ncbi:MAG TPA: class II aldolase/adducin family protein [Acidimicrobiales bacterium]|nr:class II aldolase/adducin family protein [Acidimicrobiales bacterium]
MIATNLDEARGLVADACRILAMEGLVDEVLGHVSMRVDEASLLVRCRGPHEHGLLFTSREDIQLASLDGELEDASSPYRLPVELPIHTETLRARPEVGAVVHAHPPEVVLCSITGLEYRPVFGAFNIPAMKLAGVVPTLDFAGLVRRRERATAMVELMGDAPVCVLRGHGLTAVGATVQQAVVRALNFTALARMTALVTGTGREASLVTDEDLEDLPDLGSAFNDEQVWRYYLAKARHRGVLEP